MVTVKPRALDKHLKTSGRHTHLFLARPRPGAHNSQRRWYTPAKEERNTRCRASSRRMTNASEGKQFTDQQPGKFPPLTPHPNPHLPHHPRKTTRRSASAHH
jgi:hypothetical protein